MLEQSSTNEADTKHSKIVTGSQLNFRSIKRLKSYKLKRHEKMLPVYVQLACLLPNYLSTG